MREKNVVLTNKVILVTGAAGFIGSMPCAGAFERGASGTYYRHRQYE